MLAVVAKEARVAAIEVQVRRWTQSTLLMVMVFVLILSLQLYEGGWEWLL